MASQSNDENKVRVRNTAKHPAFRIPPGECGFVDPDVLKVVKYLKRVDDEGKPVGGGGKR